MLCVSGDDGLEWLFDEHGGIVIHILHHHRHHHMGCVGLRVWVHNLQHWMAQFAYIKMQNEKSIHTETFLRHGKSEMTLIVMIL